MENSEGISWQAPEYLYREKSSDWFWSVGIITVAGTESAEVVAEKAQLNTELLQIEKEIEEQRVVLQAKQREAVSLQRDVSILNAKIKKTQLGIRGRVIVIENLLRDIQDKGEIIVLLEKKTKREKDSLSQLLRKTDEIDSASLVEVVLGNKNLSDFFIDIDSFESIKQALSASLQEIYSVKQTIDTEKRELEEKKRGEVELKETQKLEKKALEKKEENKRYILKITKGKEAEYQKIIKKKEKTAAEIRVRIFRLSGGGELPFGEAVEIALFAERASGIRAAFILAILTQESSLNGVIGRNLGRCFYNTSWDNKSGTVMRNSQKPSFLAIMSEIGRDPATTPVSCPIKLDGEYGGAMGPAQFMPATWWDINNQTGYKKRVKKINGSNLVSPFNNADAFVATALYLKDAYNSNACTNYAEENKHISPKQILQERCTAAKYYGGNNWYIHRWGYGESVIRRIETIQKDIDILLAQ